MENLIYNYKKWIPETDPDKLYKLLNGFLEKSGYTILNYSEYYFNNQGYTGVWLLAESHLAIHTFPEHSTTYLELSGCNDKMNTILMRYITDWINSMEL